MGLAFAHALMSHRGGSLEFVENTLPAFRYSGNVLRADLLELDLAMTRDGQIVVFHDRELSRMCGAPYANRRVSDFAYAQLPPLQIPAHLADKPHVTSDPDSTRIPLLRELLAEFPTYPMQIDVKDGSEDLVRQTACMLREFRREHVTLWGSFLDTPNQLCWQHAPDIPLFFSGYRFMQAYLLYQTGMLSWMHIKEQALIIPYRPSLISRGFVLAMRQRGVSVILFGVPGGGLNREEDWHAARAMGANGICSDAPTQLAQWLAEHPLDRIDS
jgi:glycerophosphoryl diester phosphodiesterase